MDHSLTQEEVLIGDMAQGLFADRFPIAMVRRLIDADIIAPDGGKAIGAAGLLGVMASSAAGGAELGATAALQVAMAASRQLVPFPVVDGIVAAAMLGDIYPDMAREVIAGERTIVFPAAAASSLTRDGDHVTGTIEAAPFALAADGLLAEIGNGEGTHHLLIDLGARGVTRTARTSIDPTCPMGTITLDQVAIDQGAPIGRADPRWRRLRAILTAGELVGAARVCLRLAVDYMKVRRQFGQEIGRFQALKHLAAEMALAIENMTVANDHAAWTHDARDAEAEMAAAIAKSHASEHARRVAEGALQCHGAIGFTWDYDLHLYLRRILRLSASAGTAAEHRARIAALLRDRLTHGEDA